MNVIVDAFKTVIDTSPYERWFTQFGDSALLMYASSKVTTYQTSYITFNVYDSVFEQCMSYVVGFILKDPIIRTLFDKYVKQQFIIQVQICNR